jgi:hypothetical protein
MDLLVWRQGPEGCHDHFLRPALTWSSAAPAVRSMTTRSGSSSPWVATDDHVFFRCHRASSTRSCNVPHELIAGRHGRTLAVMRAGPRRVRAKDADIHHSEGVLRLVGLPQDEAAEVAPPVPIGLTPRALQRPGRAVDGVDPYGDKRAVTASSSAIAPRPAGWLSKPEGQPWPALSGRRPGFPLPVPLRIARRMAATQIAAVCGHSTASTHRHNRAAL